MSHKKTKKKQAPPELSVSIWGKLQQNKYGIWVRSHRPFSKRTLQWGDRIEFVFFPAWVQERLTEREDYEKDVDDMVEDPMKYSETMFLRWQLFVASQEWTEFLQYCFDDISIGSQKEWQLVDRKVFATDIDGDLALRITGTLFRNITKRQPIPIILTKDLYDYWEDAFYKSTSEGEMWFDQHHRIVMGTQTRMLIRKIA